MFPVDYWVVYLSEVESEKDIDWNIVLRDFNHILKLYLCIYISLIIEKYSWHLFVKYIIRMD